MKVYGLFFLGVTLFISTQVVCEQKEERQASVIAGELAKDVIPIVLNFAKALVKKIWDNWVDKDNLDVVVMGRAFRIHTDAANQVTVTDRASHVHATTQGVTLQAATNSACEKLVKELLLKGVMSVDDLHLPPTLPPSTLPPCVDHNGEAYCKPMVGQGYCQKNTVFYNFMSENCYKSCFGC